MIDSFRVDADPIFRPTDGQYRPDEISLERHFFLNYPVERGQSNKRVVYNIVLFSYASITYGRNQSVFLKRNKNWAPPHLFIDVVNRA